MGGPWNLISWIVGIIIVIILIVILAHVAGVSL